MRAWNGTCTTPGLWRIKQSSPGRGAEGPSAPAAAPWSPSPDDVTRVSQQERKQHVPDAPACDKRGSSFNSWYPDGSMTSPGPEPQALSKHSPRALGVSGRCSYRCPPLPSPSRTVKHPGHEVVARAVTRSEAERYYQIKIATDSSN